MPTQPLPESAESNLPNSPFYGSTTSRPWHPQCAGKPCTKDEEANHGFWGASPPFHYLDKIAPVDADQDVFKCSFRLGYAFWRSLSVMLSVSWVLLFSMCLGFGHYSMSTALAECVDGGNLSPVGRSYEMKFCLVTPNRSAPGPQRWRYMPSTSHDDCAAETLTLRAGSAEQWKLRPDDEILIASQRSHSAMREKGKDQGKSIHSKVLEDLGDDLAEEGRPRW